MTPLTKACPRCGKPVQCLPTGRANRAAARPDDFLELGPGERTDAENAEDAREWLEANPPIKP